MTRSASSPTRLLFMATGLPVLLLLVLAACDATGEAPDAPDTPAADAAMAATTAPLSTARSADRCVNVQGAAAFDLGFPVVLPISDPPLAGAGALPTPIDLGAIAGTLSSVLTDPGDGGPGAQHWRLVHYFVDGDGDAFWTEDRAVCAPTDNPSTCRINDVMTVVGGTGKFEHASGSLRNNGLVTITDPTFSTSPYGTVDGNIRGRVCGDGL